MTRRPGKWPAPCLSSPSLLEQHVESGLTPHFGKCVGGTALHRPPGLELATTESGAPALLLPHLAQGGAWDSVLNACAARWNCWSAGAVTTSGAWLLSDAKSATLGQLRQWTRFCRVSAGSASTGPVGSQRHIAVRLVPTKRSNTQASRRASCTLKDPLFSPRAISNSNVAKPLRCRLRLHAWEDRENRELITSSGLRSLQGFPGRRSGPHREMAGSGEAVPSSCLDACSGPRRPTDMSQRS